MRLWLGHACPQGDKGVELQPFGLHEDWLGLATIEEKAKIRNIMHEWVREAPIQ